MDFSRFNSLCRSNSESSSASINSCVHVSLTPFKELKRATISQLVVNEPAKDFYLLLRIVESTIHPDVISTVVEDHTGTINHFLIYNFLDPDLELNTEDIFPVGTVLILKEPLLSNDQTVDSIIRCDCPTDIIILAKHHKLYDIAKSVSWKNEICIQNFGEEEIITSEYCKSLGNKRFNNKLYQGAIEAYFTAFSLTNDKKLQSVLYSNISAAYLKLEFFELALYYAKLVLDHDNKNMKAWFRAGRAHYELRQYGESKSCFEGALRLCPKNTDSVSEFSRCVARLQEQEGIIDVYKLFLTATLKPKTRIDCADYTGPLKIVPIPGKGRGVISTKDIEPGTLLCVSKAIRESFNESSKGKMFQERDIKNTESQCNNSQLAVKLTHTAMKNPLVFGTLIFDLTSNEDNDIVLFGEDNSNDEPIADISRIRKIVNINSYSIEAPNSQERAITCNPLDDGVGLFRMPAYMNHSCMFNASWQTYNDVMVVYAVKHIRCGEEICLSYFNNFLSFTEREQRCLKRSFTCLCVLCEQDRIESSSVHEERTRLLRELNFLAVQSANLSEKDKVLKMLQDVTLQIEQTYENSERTALKLCLFVPYLKQALCMFQTKQLLGMLNALDQALQSVELSLDILLRFIEEGKRIPSTSLMSPMLFHVIVMFVCGYSYFGNESDAEKWCNALLKFEKMFTGGNKSMVKAKYKYLPDRFF